MSKVKKPKAPAKKRGKQKASPSRDVAELTEAEAPQVMPPEVEPVVEAADDPTPPKPTAKRGGKGKGPKQAAPTAPKPDKPLSCLDAAAAVLADKGEPMRAKDVIDAVFAKKLWHSDAPTPAATLVSAILRDMKKGEASRFKKAGRGLFRLDGSTEP